MNTVFKKLNFKSHEEILVLHSPESFKSDLSEIEHQTQIRTKLSELKRISFCLIFVKKKIEIEKVVSKISNLLKNDAVFGFAYPKGTSKKYSSDFNRDSGWESLGELGYEGVRMVAIDEDWSALRFRKAEKIKSMKRRKSMALSDEGKKKTKGK